MLLVSLLADNPLLPNLLTLLPPLLPNLPLLPQPLPAAAVSAAHVSCDGAPGGRCAANASSDGVLIAVRPAAATVEVLRTDIYSPLNMLPICRVGKGERACVVGHRDHGH